MCRWCPRLLVRGGRGPVSIFWTLNLTPLDMYVRAVLKTNYPYLVNKYFQKIWRKNKYAIHAYTHGPVTGSGSTAQSKPFLLSGVVASCPWPGELAKGPHPSSSLLLVPPLFSQCEAHGPPIGVGREKNTIIYLCLFLSSYWINAAPLESSHRLH